MGRNYIDIFTHHVLDKKDYAGITVESLEVKRTDSWHQEWLPRPKAVEGFLHSKNMADHANTYFFNINQLFV
jgi:hypothetical protein